MPRSSKSRDTPHSLRQGQIRAAQGASLGEQISCDIICGLTASQLLCSHETNYLLPMVCQRLIFYISAVFFQDMSLIWKIFFLYSLCFSFLSLVWFFHCALPCHYSTVKVKSLRPERLSAEIWLMEKLLPLSYQFNPLSCSASSNTSSPHKHTSLLFAIAPSELIIPG